MTEAVGSFRVEIAPALGELCRHLTKRIMLALKHGSLAWVLSSNLLSTLDRRGYCVDEGNARVRHLPYAKALRA